MEQFAAVAVAHFLALLIPGVDFLLIARTSMTHGWRSATGTCLGIATANGILICAAFAGLSFVSSPIVHDVIQLVGGLFLISVGVAFLRSDARIDLRDDAPLASTGWLRNVAVGLSSGLLNPKNALFYVSLGAALGADAPLPLYGAWMVAVVLTWDVFVAFMLGSRITLLRMERFLPWLTRAAGCFLCIFGGAMVVSLSGQR
ncbi:LysE family translocator [Tessaracoccus palaemonis]|uniref:LysE family translocator n=1 Tax=Tessaracoccus palaemonis TaxID=2829499 RepID=A0ABX8SJ19_9ACTN|nr:LysE family translocator [Tessaracoccus palaemonis]QXT63305.1 LysE family translocator [Tessaracoccus palaemonis]